MIEKTVNKQALLPRIGWLAAECGKEDAHIARLEAELQRRKARRDAMWKECSELQNKVENMDKQKGES